MLTHLPLGDSGTRLQDTLCPGHRCFDDFTSRQLGLSRPAPFVIATHIQVTQARDTGQPQKSGAYHLQFTNTPECPETTQASQRPQRETEGVSGFGVGQSVSPRVYVCVRECACGVMC